MCWCPIQILAPDVVYGNLMEMHLSDQQLAKLLLYLDNICVFAASLDKILDLIEMASTRLK